jgi:hypothetical protein
MDSIHADGDCVVAVSRIGVVNRSTIVHASDNSIMEDGKATSLWVTYEDVEFLAKPPDSPASKAIAQVIRAIDDVRVNLASRFCAASRILH